MKHIIAAVAALFTLPVHAACVPVTDGLPGWERLDFDDITPNTWTVEDGALVATANDSASMLYTRLPAGRGPILTWRWRVDQAVPATDLTRKGGDDRSISLTIGFAYDSANASMGERMRRVVVENVAGADAPGRVVDLVWGGMQPVGTRRESPYSGRSGQVLIRRTANEPAGEWQAERVDLAALYSELWGSAMPPITQAAVFIDTDDTNTAGQARIADICFSN